LNVFVSIIPLVYKFSLLSKKGQWESGWCERVASEEHTHTHTNTEIEREGGWREFACIGVRVRTESSVTRSDYDTLRLYRSGLDLMALGHRTTNGGMFVE
jgi:hypothetical protein